MTRGSLSKCPYCGTEGQLYVRGGTFWAAGVTLNEDGTYNLSDGSEYTTEDELIVCGACETKFLLERTEDGSETLIPLDGEFQLQCHGGRKGRIVSDGKLTTIEVEGPGQTVRLQLPLPALRRLSRRLLAHT